MLDRMMDLLVDWINVMSRTLKEDLRKAGSYVVFAIVVLWLIVLSILGIMYLPWPTTDAAHMKDCVNSGGQYEKHDRHNNDWTCKGGK